MTFKDAIDTIYALATAPGRGGVAVIRVSGPAAGAAAASLTGRADLPPPRLAELRRFRGPDGGPIDRGLLLWFEGPASFTGEDVAEFYVHGGPAVVTGMIEALAAVPGCRMAAPGEFTRRAFANGRMDLTQAEALADLVAAETAAQRRQALRQLEGALGALHEGWRAELIGILAHVEAEIDFADEADVPKGLAGRAAERLRRLSGEIAAHLDDRRRGERLREGISIVILGAPNAGKSSLLNTIARREAAIVSSIAGTTRDVVEVQLDLGGYPVALADTAGLHEAAGEIENEGIRRALARAAGSDLKLVLFDAQTLHAPEPAALDLLDEGALAVISKIDLADPGAAPEVNGRPALPVSVRTGQGMEALLARLEEEVRQRLGTRETPSLTRARHRQALEECLEALRRAAAGTETALVAEDLRLAIRALGRIAGRVDVEDILDQIFREFCIGK